jgi:methyl-accepting chemotaxis protein
MATPSAPTPPSPTRDQLDAIAELTNLMKELSDSSKKLTSDFELQANALNKVCDALKCVKDNSKVTTQLIIDSRNLTGATGGLTAAQIALAKQLRDSQNAAAGASDEHRRASEELQKHAKSSKLLGAAIGGVTGFFSGLLKGLQSLLAMTKAIFGFFIGLADAVWNVGKAIISIPFKMLDALIAKADEGGNSISELAAAANRMREVFGTLSGPTNKAIVATATAMNNLKLAGVSTFQVFGTVAERQEALIDLFDQGGPSLRLFTKEIIESNGAILGFQKGLGLTNEDLGKFATIAKSSGRPVNKVLTEITKYADNMAKHFELDIKKVSREMAKAAGDFKNFGNISEKQLSIAVTYAQKLGLSLDKITGTMDAFGDFDTAADNVSKLNEAFGTNIDAMEILQAQTPHEKMDILRRSMRGVGVEGEKLNAAQRKLITGATGIDDETAVLALSTKNYGVSLKEIEKQASKTQKKTMTQAEAMEKLSDSMARMAKAAEALTGGGGLFGSLMNGFMKGVEGSKEFQAMMTSLKGVILKVFEVGRNLGRVFVTSFPGVNKVFGALADFAKKIAPMFDRMNKVITEFIEGLTKPGGEASFSTLMTKLKDIFFQYFNKDAPEGKRLLEGFKEFGAAVFEIFSQMAVWVIEKMSEAIDYIADWISNPELPNVDASGAGAVFMNSLNRILDVVQNKLGPALMKLGGVIWDKLKEALSDPENQKYIKYALMGIGGLILAPAIIQGIAGAFAGGQIQGMISGAGGSGGIFGSLTGALTQQGQAAARGGGPGAPGAGTAPIPPPPPAPPPIPPLPIPSPTDIRNMEGAADSKVDWNKLSSFMLNLAALFAVGGGVYLMFKNVVEFVKTVDIIDIIKAGITMYVIGKTVVQMAEAVGMINMSSPFFGKVNVRETSRLMTAVSIMMMTGLLSFYLATKVVAGVSIVNIIKAGIAMAEIAALMYAVVPLIKAAQLVGDSIKGKEVETRKALIAMGLVMLEIAGVALVVISALGKFTPEQTSNAFNAAGAVGILMAGAGGLIYEASKVAEAVGKNAGKTVLALAAMGVVVLGVGEVAKLLITKLGEFTMDKIGNTIAAMAGVGILFAASGLLLVEAAALGAATGGTGGVGVGAVITGLVGMIAVIGIVGAAAYELISNFGEFSMDKVGVTIAAMVGTGLLFAGAGALLAEAAAVGAGFAAAGFAAAGMIAMGLAIATVAETALVLIEQFGNIPKSKVDITLKMMEGTVSLYSAAGDLVKQAREIAKGIGLNDYLVILEGIRTIEGVVINICDMVLKVVKEIAQIKEKPEELSKKTENFTKIVDSMANFVKTLAELSKMIEPGWFESTSSVERRFNKVIELISVIVEGKRGGGGVIGIINAVTRAVTSVSKESLEKGKAFAEIISATARLVDSMTKPVTELNKNAVAAGEGAAKGQLISAQAIGNMADFIDRVTPQIKWLVSSLIGALTGLSKRELEKLEKGGPAIAGVLSAVAKFAEAVKPGSVSLSNIGTATGGAGGGGEGASGGEAHARAVVTINQTVPSLKDMLDALKNVIPDLMKSMISAIQSVPSGEEFRKKIDDAIAVFGVLGPLSEAAATMVQAGKDNQGGNYDPSPVTSTLDKLKIFFKSMLGYTHVIGMETSLLDVLNILKKISESPMFHLDYAKITENISGSMSSMVTTADSVKGSTERFNITEADVKKIKDKMTDMYNFFDDLRNEEEGKTSLKNLANVVSKLSESVGQNQTAVQNSASSLTEFFSTFDQIVQGIVGFAGYADPISKAKTSIKDMSDSFGAIVGGVGSLFFNVAQIQKLFVTLIEGGADTSIDSLSENMLRIGDKFNTYIKSNQVFLSKVNEGAESLKKMADVLTITVAAGLLPAVKAADDMIMAGKMIEEKLNQGAKFDIDAKLQAFADNFGQGVGMGAAYTVKGKDVNVDLTVKIVIDPTELERIMVTRASSPLKQRINLLLEAVSGNDNAKNNALAAKIYPGTQPTQMSY